MHLTQAMVSPAVAGAMGAVAAVALVASARHVRAHATDSTLPTMATLGGLVFALQMADFAVPGTGVSGHIGGGVLLAMLLGPHAGLLVMAAVLAVQAVWLGDGGLVTLGANIVNLGLLPSLVVALCARTGGGAPSGRRAFVGIVACVLALQLGALAVVAQTGISGTAAPSWLAASLLPIHLALGLVEGAATVALLAAAHHWVDGQGRQPFALPVAIAAAALAFGAVALWFASRLPDALQALLAGAASQPAAAAAWLHVDVAASASGIVGVLLTTAVVAAITRSLHARRRLR